MSYDHINELGTKRNYQEPVFYRTDAYEPIFTVKYSLKK